MKKILEYLSISVLLVIVCSCQHKSLDELQPILGVSYDWSKASSGPDGQMEVFFLPESKGERVKATVDGRNGDMLFVKDGTYTAVTFTSGADNIVVKELPSGIVLSTCPVSSTENLPKSQYAQGEAILMSPGNVNAETQKLILSRTERQILSATFSPVSIVTSVHVIMKNVSLFNDLKEVTATLSGMASSWHSSGTDISSPQEPCTLVVPLAKVSDNLEAGFLSFGDYSQFGSNYLCAYFILDDGKIMKYTSDVSDQVVSSASSGHIEISVDCGILIDGNRFSPDVDEWEPVYDDISVK